MPRVAEPRYWPQRRLWYVMHQRTRHVLHRLQPGETERNTKHLAFEAYGVLVAQMKADGTWDAEPGESISVATLARRYLEHCEKVLAPTSFRTYKMVVKQFVAACGPMRAEDVRPSHVERVYASMPICDNSRHLRITIVQAWWKWAVASGYIGKDAVKTAKRPPATPRANVPTPDECRRLLAAEKPRWAQDVLETIHGTGCRPSEVFRLTAADVDLAAGCWRLHGKTTRKTGKLREVHFPSGVRKILVRLLKAHRTGPLFRRPGGASHLDHSSFGEEIIKARLAERLGPHVTAGAMRHLFATDALERGVSPTTLAALLGHADISQIMKTYGRLIDRKDHLKAALKEIRGE